MQRPATLVQLTARRGQQPALAAAIWQRLQLNLPQPGHSTSDGAYTLIWIQPGGWLLQAPADIGNAFSVQLKSALAGIAAVVDQSHGKCVLQVSGLSTLEVFARCCRLDLHPRVFDAGRCAVTLVARVSCVLRQVDATPCFDLIVASTFEMWLLEELQEASHAFGSRFIPANAVVGM
ncbi:hypothetical protein CQ12_18605 [Bradyrhizobium jicamae]|uniref:Sarcosine oxidase subunit gamma n=2 Tax=Bradyrhizobium jicamae TaxID=280332 RepID=A0A0R3L335_9BRAD|nr:hypothetical protein CQ12_18605 [Bradyrhizobium jicamae]